MAFDLENMYLARTNKLLEVKEIRNTEDKVKNITSTSRIAISLKKGTQDDIGRGDLLTNKVVFSGKYIFAILNGNDNKFKKKGSNRLFIGTINQIVKILEKLGERLWPGGTGWGRSRVRVGRMTGSASSAGSCI